MLIFKKKKNKQNSFPIKILKYFKSQNNKIKVILTSSGIATFALICVPLDSNFSKSLKLNVPAEKIANLVIKFNYESGYLIKDVFDSGSSIFEISKKFISSSIAKNKVLHLDIGIKNLNYLRNKRDEAIQKGVLIRDKDDEVKASLKYKGEIIPVKIRLKGDLTDHFAGEKWSYRVKVKGDNALFGMRNFSLQHPRTRNYFNEYFYHRLFKYEKMPYLRYDFITLKLNGKGLGVYALEEHFGKELVENSGYREGPIIKFIEDDFWINKARTIKRVGFDNNDITEYKSYGNNANIGVFNAKKLNQDIVKSSQFQAAKNLLNDFLIGKKTTSEVFDLEKTAIYFAINDILGSSHAYDWHNIRFYFNPINSRLIPIGYLYQ